MDVTVIITVRVKIIIDAVLFLEIQITHPDNYENDVVDISFV